MLLLQVVADTVPAIPTPTTGVELVFYLVSLGVGALVGSVVKLLERGSELVAKLPEVVKLAIIAVLAFLVVKVETFLGLQLPDNPLDWNPDTVNVVLTATAAVGLRAAGIKKKTPPPPTV
jgi:peptidoglycan/LPS O-acetylase OafA/YrhL